MRDKSVTDGNASVPSLLLFLTSDIFYMPELLPERREVDAVIKLIFDRGGRIIVFLPLNGCAHCQSRINSAGISHGSIKTARKT